MSGNSHDGGNGKREGGPLRNQRMWQAGLPLCLYTNPLAMQGLLGFNISIHLFSICVVSIFFDAVSVIKSKAAEETLKLSKSLSVQSQRELQDFRWGDAPMTHGKYLLFSRLSLVRIWYHIWIRLQRCRHPVTWHFTEHDHIIVCDTQKADRLF